MPQLRPDTIMQFFHYTELPSGLQAVAKPFADLADVLQRDLPQNPERTDALRLLLRARDAALRAATFEG